MWVTTRHSCRVQVADGVRAHLVIRVFLLLTKCALTLQNSSGSWFFLRLDHQHYRARSTTETRRTRRVRKNNVLRQQHSFPGKSSHRTRTQSSVVAKGPSLSFICNPP